MTGLAVIMVGTLATGALYFGNARAADNVPPIGGDYAGGANVVAIPIDDPEVKAISGALFKPAGSGPFPVVVFMPSVLGLGYPSEMAFEKNVIDHLAAKGVATFIVDPFTARGEPYGIDNKFYKDTFVKYASRGGDDVVAAVNVVKATPGIDPNHVFLLGQGYGAITTLFAVDASGPVKRNPNTKIAGVIAYYPFCYDKMDPGVPTLVMIGDKDTVYPAEACQAAAKDKPNVELVVYPGETNAFAVPVPPGTMGIVYDATAAADTMQRAEAFIAAHLK
jgi:dienelactone hydrolase